MRNARWVVLGMALAWGCGGAGTPVEEPSPTEGATPVAESAPPPPESGPVTLDGPEGDITLHMEEDRLVLGDPPSSEVTCTALERGDVAPYAGDETLWRCAHSYGAHLAVALTSGNALLWAVSFPLAECYPEADPIALVDAVADAPREVRVRVLECDRTGAMVDDDRLFKWVNGEMRAIATAQLACDDMSDTSDPDAEVPQVRRWLCEGTALELSGPSDGPVLTRRTVARVYARAARDAQQALQFGPEREGEDGPEPMDPERDLSPRVLRYDAATSEFIE